MGGSHGTELVPDFYHLVTRKSDAYSVFLVDIT